MTGRIGKKNAKSTEKTMAKKEKLDGSTML